MDSSTPQNGFQPINLENNSIIRPLDPWETTRVIEQETDRLLNECFPGWATHGDPVAHDEWRLLCQELILQSGTLLCDAWQVLHPKGTVEVTAHTSNKGLPLVIYMKADDTWRAVYLVTTLLFELKRKRWVGSPESGESFSFFETLRATYQVPANAPQRPPVQLPGQFAAYFVRTWRADLVKTVTAPEGSDRPAPKTKK